MSGKQSLHSLLERMNDVHRKDIKEINVGHLNENKFLQDKGHEKKKKKKIWNTANQSSLRLRNKVSSNTQVVTPNRLPPIEKHVGDMNDAFVEFSCGTYDSRLTKVNNVEERIETLKNENRNKNNHHESMLPDVMLPRADKQKDCTLEKTFIPTHHILPTKSSQYRQIRNVHNGLFSKEAPFGRNSQPSLQIIERKLYQRLKSLENHDHPNFHVLNIYSDAWDEICNISETYGDTLKSIKYDYDTYARELMDAYINCDSAPVDDLNILEDRTLYKEDREKIEKLEAQVMHELHENNRLRQEVKEKKEDFADKLGRAEGCSGPSLESDYYVHTKENDLERQVEHLHALIELQLNELEEMKKTRKENYVPLAVCERLEHCIKETEVDIQKLSKQNEFLEENIEELEEELEDVLVKAGVKKKDARLLWRRVSTSHVLDA
ncbi:uncharacterized protein C6orf118-like [Hydractinia symbiolongicarpus]|uniref:uncharacterized protein C6orf118-like n=1 Tax=Hydractinia symbiolongicarpus TaxID=13093 RepID=UPI00254A2EBF|nr:uncharacterized protein C6orf118-like [Hydractinia symbiolongicarpus]